MELLIGFLLFDFTVYLLLRFFAKPRPKNASNDDFERRPTRRVAPSFRYPPSMHSYGRGMFLRPGNWPRTPFRHRPPQ